MTLASGTTGWRGSTGDAGQISLYGGIRSLEKAAGADLTIQPSYLLDTYTIDGKMELSASYPFTGTVSYVQCVDREIDQNTALHDSFWGDEHFRPILNLYEYYSRDNADYTTGSYDYYMLYSEANGLGTSNNKITYSGSINQMIVSSSYTIETMIKPLSISGSAEDHTLISRTNAWSLYITGSDGTLSFSASDGSGLIRTSSIAVTENRWQHVAYRVGSGTGSFHIDMVDAGVHVGVTGSIDTLTKNEVINIFFNQSRPEDTYHGFMFDTKVWDERRTFNQLSASFDRTLINSGSNHLLLYPRFNDGPLSTAHTFAKGSGSFDRSNSTNHGLLSNFSGRKAPIWHPNDNQNHIVPKKLIGDSLSEIRVLHLPSMYYGRSIMTGSVRMTCNTYLSSSLMRTLVDDGRGGLYLSGSAVSSSLDEREEHGGVKWPKVGNVFYSEGLIVIKDPALLDFGTSVAGLSIPFADLLQVSFSGQQTVPTKVFMCRINGAAANASNNQSFAPFNSGSDQHRVIRDNPTTYVTAVGLYNKERKLVAVAKLAQPLRNREKDKINVRLKLDF